ncbi:hypothetical protein GGR54DRAFT_644364 [Hypoxylon sp. NC1633]|nr:hypothetical protein GGR54DRAFT_644364 [Hypoxylon sp. NC1633]
MDYATPPFINLITEGHKSRNVTGYFMEPENDVHDDEGGGLTQKDYDCDRRIPTHFSSFGSLSHVYQKETRGFPQDYVFFRRDHGSIDYGLGRNNEDAFECAKFNVLRHPRENKSNSTNYHKDRPKSATEFEKSMLALANYPNIPNGVMSGPFLPKFGPRFEDTMVDELNQNGHFKKAQIQQPYLLEKVLATPELCFMIMVELAGRVEDLSNFSRSCQTAMYAIARSSTRVDFTHGNFQNLNFTDTQIEEANAEVADDDCRGKFLKPGPAAFLIVSNVRSRYKGAEEGEDKPNKYGYPARPSWSYRQPNAQRQVANSVRLLLSINARGLSMRVLHLHSVPNLDVSVIELFLGGLPNLQVLGIYNCELMHFGETVPLLRMIIDRNFNRRKSFVRCDFHPKYYPGPQRRADGRRGEYGVIPGDQGLVETRRAIAAVLRTAIPMALENGIDWFTPGTGMRKFLDRIPFALGTIRYILEALYNIHTWSNGMLHPGGDLAIPPQRHRLTGLMELALYNDLVLAVHGRAMDRVTLERMTTVRGNLALIRCAFCYTGLPTYFYASESPFRTAAQIECTGCRLRKLLDRHVENYYPEKKRLVRILFGDPRHYSIDYFMCGTRPATDEELHDRDFPFFQLSVMTRFEIWAMNRDRQYSVILDNRPGPDYPEEARKIYVRPDCVRRAMIYAEERIDRGLLVARDSIVRAKRTVRFLDSNFFDGPLRSAFAIRENRDRADALMRNVGRELARVGFGQVSGPLGKCAAANWDTEIERYILDVQDQADTMVNIGSNNIVWANAPTGFF